MLKAIGNAFLFEFVNETYGGKIVEKHRGSIILTNQDLNGQNNTPRWGKVISAGEKINDFSVGDFVLIDALQWTQGLKFENKTYWKSDLTKVVAVGADESVTYAF